MALNFEFPTQTVKGFSVSLVVTLTLSIFGLVIGIMGQTRGSSGDSKLIRIFSLLVFATWLSANLTMRIGGHGVDYSVLVLPLLLLTIAITPPSKSAVYNAMGWLVSLTLVVILFSEWRVLEVGRTAKYVFIGVEWEWISSMLQLEHSWYGPFEWVSISGIVGTFMFAYGISHGGWARWIALPSGFMIVLASQTQTSILALAAVAIVILCYSRDGVIGTINLRARRATGLALLITVVGAIAYIDPSLNGRNRWFAACIDVWSSNPLMGYMSIENGPSVAISQGCNYAHNMLLELLARHGIVGVFFTFAVVLFGVVIAIKAARLGNLLALSIVTAFLTIGVSEAPGDLVGISWSWMWFLLAVLYAEALIRGKASRAPNGRLKL